MGAAARDLPAVRLPARHVARHHRADRRRGHRAALARPRWPGAAALASRRAADRDPAGHGGVQLPVRARRGAGRVPGRRAGLRGPAGGEVSALPDGRSAAAPWPPRRSRAGIASAACRARLRREPGSAGAGQHERDRVAFSAPEAMIHTSRACSAGGRPESAAPRYASSAAAPLAGP